MTSKILSEDEIYQATKYAYQHHPEFEKTMPFWRYLSFFQEYKNRITVEYEEEEIVGVAMYMLVNDTTLDGIQRRIFDIYDYAILAECLKQHGNNLHFIGVVAQNKEIVRKGLKRMIERENPETISWFRDNKQNMFLINLRK